MTQYFRAFSFLIAAVLGLAGCDSVEGVLDEDVTFVVESYQEVGQRLAQVRLSTTSEINTPYSFQDRALRGAVVRVHLLDQAGGVATTFLFGESEIEPGVYLTSSNHEVLPLRTYRLEVDLPDPGGIMTTETVTPGAFEIVRNGLDQVVYAEDPQFELGVTRSMYPGRQTVLVFSVEGLDAGFETLTPFYEDVLDLDDPPDESELDEVRVIQSPPINEANYEVEADGTLTLKLPWLAVAFYGPTRVGVSAIDDNLYDFLRSFGVQQGGSTLAPGEIPNAIDHVDGGIGLFGSFARVESETTIVE